MKKTLSSIMLLFVLISCEKSELNTSQVTPKNGAQMNATAVSYKMTVTVKTSNGTPLVGIYLYVDDGTWCTYAVTGFNGVATFNVNSKTKVIIAGYDNLKRGIYGVFSKTFLNMSSATSITMPAKPSTITTAGNMWDTFVTGLNYAKALNTLWGLYKNSQGYRVGMPGVFSISTLPTLDSQGRLGFKISGVLAQEMAKWFPRATGAMYYYSY